MTMAGASPGLRHEQSSSKSDWRGGRNRPSTHPVASRSRSLVRATFASLAYRNFTYLWLGQVTHAGALWIDTVARPLLVLELSGGSAVHLGLVMAARTVPAVVFGLFAGVVADSFNRRIVLLVTKNVVFVLGAIFAALVIGGWVELWHVYVFSLMRGFTMAFDQPARRAMIPSLVPPELVTMLWH